MRHLKELTAASEKLKINASCIIGDDAKRYIDEVFSKFNPEKIRGHLSIGKDSMSIDAEIYDLNFSKVLPKTKGYIFFEQDLYNKNSVYVIDDLSLLYDVMQECYGMEYFVSNESLDFLISVNWYVIQCLGKAQQYLRLLN
ncbi:hypothetical protein KRX19_02450 [Cardiobacteriaceae bacterium TAE3-ERU3]|nr:hypothetical protein [Cardiobacteriaceae bacterium TAE3-ERU3]